MEKTADKDIEWANIYNKRWRGKIDSIFLRLDSNRQSKFRSYARIKNPLSFQNRGSHFTKLAPSALKISLDKFPLLEHFLDLFKIARDAYSRQTGEKVAAITFCA